MAKEEKTNEAVLLYLKSQNRPFSINDLLQNAQLKDFGKAGVQKSLDQLVVAGKVKEKTYNKQKVYVIDQNLVSSTNDPDIGQIDMKIAELTKQVAVDEEAIRVAENELKAFNSMMSLEEASSELKKVKEENDTLKKKLKELTENKVKVSATDFKKVQTAREKNTSEMRKRKRKCEDMLDQILEGYPKGKKALLDEVGITPD